VAIVGLTVILLAFLSPQLDTIVTLGRWRLPIAVAVVGVGLRVLGAHHSSYDGKHPRLDTIAYWLDADTGKASWISLDEHPDTWTSQFLTGRTESDKLRILVSPLVQSL